MLNIAVFISGGGTNLQAIINAVKENIIKVVIGLPKNMNNTIGPQGEKVLSFVDELK